MFWVTLYHSVTMSYMQGFELGGEGGGIIVVLSRHMHSIIILQSRLSYISNKVTNSMGGKKGFK